MADEWHVRHDDEIWMEANGVGKWIANCGSAKIATQIVHAHNSRLSPAATETGLVTVGEVSTVRESIAAFAGHMLSRQLKPGDLLCRRSQAEEILATKDAAIKRWRSECERAQSQNVELAEHLAKAEADVSRWHQKAMDAGVITHSDGTTSHPMRKERDDLKADNAEKDREIGQLKAALGADAAQFMQSLVDECSREIEKRKALEAKLAAVERALTLPDAERRLFFISELLAKRGYFNRADLCSTFGISVPQASIDIRKWMAANNGEAFYNKATKRYEGGDCPASEDAK